MSRRNDDLDRLHKKATNQGVQLGQLQFQIRDLKLERDLAIKDRDFLRNRVTLLAAIVTQSSSPKHADQ